MTLTNRALLLLLIVFSFACKDENELICPADQDLGPIALSEEGLAAIPYKYNEHQRLVFINEAGQEMTFVPALQEVVVNDLFDATSYDCSNGGSYEVSYEYQERIYKYTSTSGIRLEFFLRTEVEKYLEDPAGYRLLDHLAILMYKGEVTDGNLNLSINQRMTIPVSFRGEAPFEYFDEHLFADFQAELDLGQKHFQGVYLSEKYDPKMVFNQQQGLISFLDEEGERWVIERFEALDGEVAYNFSLPDTANDIQQLNDVEGKLILLDFWASWCEPCREEIAQYLKPLYETYREEGLEIVSISLDTDRESWISAIEEDGMSWMQLSDLEGYQSSLLVYYEIYGIPTVYVLDENKNILSKNLRGESLAIFVQEYLN